MTFSWGPIPTDLPVEVGMFEVFIGPIGFNADGAPAEQITYCRVAASETSCEIQDIPEGEWDAVVFMTSVTNDSFWSPSLTFALSSTASVPSPVASTAPTPTQNVGAACPSLLMCMKSAKEQPLTNAPTLVYHYSESVHPKSKAALEALGAEYLGIYAGFYKDIKPGTKINIYLSLDPTWCAKQLAETQSSSSVAEVEKSYLCVQDGGANAGRSGTLPKTGIVVLRPSPMEVAGVEAGTSKSVMVRNIFIAELGHASRGLRHEITTGRDGAEGVPIWLQYVSNEGGSFLVGVEDGMSEAQREDESTWWGEPKRPTWRPTYTDKRLDSWAGGGLFETPNGKRIVPNSYNLAYMAARHLIPKHGLFAIQDTLIGTILDTRGDLNAGAVALGYASWADLLGELDEAMLAYYAAAGVTVPAK